jgi:hypothetical protein
MYEPKDPNLAIIHKFLLQAAETERRMPPVRNKGTVTVWPEVAAERNVDFRPDKTFVTVCRATNKQIDNHAHADDLINLLDEEDRLLVRKVLKKACFRRVPPWHQLAKHFHCDRRTVTRRYEKALFVLLCRDTSRNVRLVKKYRLA